IITGENTLGYYQVMQFQEVNTDSGEVTYIGQFPIAAEYNTRCFYCFNTLVVRLIRAKNHARGCKYNGRSVYSNDTSDIK
ncbi:hypothetical protein FQR65_LT19849, partial [Abscondita terminalis]